MEVFNKGKPVVCDAIGIDKNGKKTHYIAHSFPIKSEKGNKIEYAMELTRTVTETDRWQQEYHILFDRVPCFITVIGEDYKIVRANEAFRENFGDVVGQYCYEVYKRRSKKCSNCPAEKTFKDGKIHHSRKTGISKRGQKIHYAVSTSALMKGTNNVAHVIEISNDITALKQLEHKVIETERLCAVGQTVAGLAHSIKNILMGLEGGKYIVSLGLAKDDKAMISQGWEMLERNFEKTTTLVKDFLSFSKGRLPELKMINPASLVNEIINLYKDIAAQSGILLKAEIDNKLKLAPLDEAGIHTCLTNLVSNAIDGCLMGEQKGNEVVIKVSETRGQLCFEVKDNGSGFDNEIKKKIFTTFFTTKGGAGTGLGLLTTRKIVQEHGGKIAVDSQKGIGSKFKIILPRKRLMSLYKETKE
jgi:PAS domain S-box-containing protein